MLEFLRTIWDPIATPAGGVLGALALQLWKRYLSRMVTVRWSVTHDTLAAGGDNPTFGRVEILYNGAPVAGNLLQWCRVEIENESGSRDLSNVSVSLQYDQVEPMLLSGGGGIEGSNQWLQWTPAFRAEIDRFAAMRPEDRPNDPGWDVLFRRRDYVIPVLNRGEKVVFLFLVRPGIANPTLRVYCDHLNVRLRHRPQRPMTLGVVQQHAIIAGLIVGLAVAVALALNVTNIWAAVFAALIVGWFGQLWGVAIIRGWRWFVRMVG